MKIISGKFGGRKLHPPQSNDIRPTSDKIRGAVFNMLASRDALAGACVLDAFCGTGALGLEALSRGACHCTFIDRLRSSLDLAKENAAMLKVTDICDFALKDASKMGGSTAPYNLIFLDPPYEKGLIPLTLETLKAGGFFAPDCWIVCESERGFSCTPMDGFVIDNEKTYGDIKITLLCSDEDN